MTASMVKFLVRPHQTNTSFRKLCSSSLPSVNSTRESRNPGGNHRFYSLHRTARLQNARNTAAMLLQALPWPQDPKRKTMTNALGHTSPVGSFYTAQNTKSGLNWCFAGFLCTAASHWVRMPISESAHHEQQLVFDPHKKCAFNGGWGDSITTNNQSITINNQNHQ